MNLFKADSTPPEGKNPRDVVEAPAPAPAAEFTSDPRVRRRGRVSRAFVPERKTGHPLWQWILVIAVRLAVVSLITFLTLSLIGIFASQYAPIGSFNLMGFNRTDRVVSAFYVNDSWGGNIFEHGGGGKATCCMSIPHDSKTVRVEWILGWETMDEANGRIPRETYEADVPIPPNLDLGDDNYLQVYFFPGNEIGVHYGQSTLASDVQPQVTGTRMPDTPYVN